MIRHRSYKLALVVIAWVLAIPGCNDPSSQRRISRRMENLNSTLTDIENREKDGVTRTEDDLKTLRHWWIQDCERWERIAPTVGDYFW